MTDQMIGWFDGGAGASGDMMLGALVGAGVPIEEVAAAVEALDVGVSLEVSSVQRAGLEATKVDVIAPDTRVVRHLPEVLALFEPLKANVRSLATAVFERLGEAEAAVHGIDLNEVHFHEVGALDSIADIVGSCAGIVHLGLDRIFCSTLSLGSGMTRGAHGPLPIPAPAVLELLAGAIPVTAGPASFESTTPTGAALLVSIVDEWGPMPAMQDIHVGAGAGGKDSDEVFNALRLVVGRADS